MSTPWREYVNFTYERQVEQGEIESASVWTAHLDVADGMAAPRVLAAIEVHPALTGEYLHHEAHRLAVYFRAPTAEAAADIGESLLSLTPAGTTSCTVTTAGHWGQGVVTISKEV